MCFVVFAYNSQIRANQPLRGEDRKNRFGLVQELVLIRFALRVCMERTEGCLEHLLRTLDAQSGQ